MALTKFWDLVPDNTDPTVLNMYIYGEIRASASWFFGSEDDVVANKFVQDLNDHRDVQTINVHINSPGGSVYAAAAIISQLRKHPACVHTWCDGMCASAAVGILMAANPGCRHMSRASLLMIHNPSAQLQGDERAFLKTIDLLAKVKKTLINIYHDSTGIAEEKLSAMMDDETYLSADEAQDLNFIDTISDQDVSFGVTANNSFICNGVSIDVAAIANRDKFEEKLRAAVSQSAAKTNQILDKGGSQQMTLLEGTVDFTQEQKDVVDQYVAAQVAAATAQASAVTSEIQDLKATNADLLQQVANLKEQLQAAQATTSTGTQDPEAEIMNSASPELKALLAQARADAIEARNQLAAVQAERDFAAFKETFNEFDKLPIQDAQIKAMQVLASNDQTMYEDLRALLKVANTAMGESFVATGSDQGEDVATTAYDVIEQKVKAYQDSNKNATYSDALSAVLRENPDLYTSYRDGMING